MQIIKQELLQILLQMKEGTSKIEKKRKQSLSHK